MVRTWKVPTVRVSNKEAKARHELEQSGEAKCVVCKASNTLHLLTHPNVKIDQIVLCDLCQEMMHRIVDWQNARSIGDLTRAILKVHELNVKYMLWDNVRVRALEGKHIH